MELDKAQRDLRTQQHLSNDLKQKLQQAEKDKNGLLLTHSHFSTEKSSTDKRESETNQEIQALQASKSDLQKELELLKGRLEMEKRNYSRNNIF